MTAKRGRKPTAFQPGLPPFGDRRHIRVGLLGGSFNPAHDGHLHVSREALRRLDLDQVWWLVSPQNPLKPAAGMARLDVRLEKARDLVGEAGLGGRVIVTDVERRLGVTRTAETLRKLRSLYPGIAFVWLMGADNLSQLSRWWRWTDLFRAARVAVFDRSPYSYRALAGRAALRFRRARRSGKALWNDALPAWTYFAIRRHPASATALRTAGQRKK